MMTLPAGAAPHTRTDRSVARTMGLVLLALLPAAAYGVWLYGWPALNVLLITCASAVLCEALCLWLAGQSLRRFLLDGSALLTGLLVAFTLPPWSPAWLCVLGSALAIILGKQVFGGLGQNLFNPAMVARVALLVAFPVEMTRFIAPLPLGSELAPDLATAWQITFGGFSDWDAYTGATALGQLKTELGRGVALADAQQHGLLDLLFGYTPGSLGETSALLILLGGLFLWAKGVIDYVIPAAMLGTVALLATVFNLYNPDYYAGALFHLSAGAVMLGAFFIATDLVTSPVTRVGQLVFGAACGLLVYVIRTFGNYPEGVGFAVLLMNAATPLIDHYLRPRRFGRTLTGKPLPRRTP